MELIKIIVVLYLLVGAVIMMYIQPRLEPKYRTMFFTIAGIIIGPACFVEGYIRGLIKIIRGGGDSNDQT